MKNLKSFLYLPIIVLLIGISPFSLLRADEVSRPQIQLANVYHEDIDVKEYLVSEKFDGVRAYFDGEKLISRQGNIFNAPKWFTESFPHEHIEGELWIERGKFEESMGIVRKEIPNDEEWQKIKFMVFDMPRHQGTFVERFAELKNIVQKSNSKYLQIVPQEEIISQESLMKKLDEVVKNNGEGLMLHRKNSFYQSIRNDDVLKLKTYEDEEAIVIDHIAGTGKFKGMMGSLLVEDKNKVRFKVGTGFSVDDRKNPPKIGSVVTYKFYGRTKNNKPRFPSFVRVYNPI